MKLVTCMIMSLIVACALAGCTGGQIQIDQDSQDVIAKIAGRRAGHELAKEYPDIAVEVLALSKAIMAEDDPDIITILADRITIVLIAEIPDPLLAADISDILGLIKIETDVGITTEQMTIIKAVAEGLASGIEMTE